MFGMQVEARAKGCGRAKKRFLAVRLRPALASVALLSLPATVEAAPLRVVETVMDGLANPRGLTFGPDGALYVAEAGSGGAGPSIVAGSGAAVSFGLSGGVTRLLGGTQERVVSGLPSLAAAGGGEATGAQDLAFDAEDDLHVLIGLGADPGVRSGALAGEAGASLLGHLVEIDEGVPTPVADIAGFEAVANPGGGPVDSNPFSVVARPDGFLVSDAGANALLAVDEEGDVDLAAAFPSRANPLPFGPPQYESVPTGAAAEADGDVFIGELTGFPFPFGEARIYRAPGFGGLPEIFATGFTNLIDLALGPDGALYALEHDSNGLLNEGANGALLSIGADGSVTTLLALGLTNPTGLAIGSNGDFYISENGLSPEEGRVLRVAPIPLPAGFPLMATVLCAIVGWRFCGRLR